jgi:N-terminal half of MaoC dehydratase
MAQDPVIRDAALEEAYKLLGRESTHEGVDEVTVSDIRRKLEVFCFDCPLHYEADVAQAHGYKTIVAPTSMTGLWSHRAMWKPGQKAIFGPNVAEIRGGGPDHRERVPLPFSKGFASDRDVEYFEPVYPGDRLYGVSRLAEIIPKRTSLGDGVFLINEGRTYKQTGELVSVGRGGAYRYDPDPERVRDAERKPREREAAPSVEVPEQTDPFNDWSKQIKFEDVEVGDELPAYSLYLTYQRLVMSVANDRMFSPVHHNRDSARSQGLDDTILNSIGYENIFEFAMRRWMGLDGRLKKLGPYRIARSCHPGDMVTCTGRVVGKEVLDGVGLDHLELAIRNPRTQAANTKATVSLPMR